MSSIHERFEINVPAYRVYEALSQPEHIVGSLPGVTSIYRFERDRYRVDIGAAGRSSELDLEVTERVPPRHIAWHSRDGRWTGSLDVESLGESRSLVIVHINDAHAQAGEAESAENAAVIDSALRALKQALETAATEHATAGAESDDIYVRQRTRAESETSREESSEDRWRGSRGIFRGSDQALAMVRSLSREMDKLWEQVMRRAASAGRGTAAFTGGWTPVIEMCEREDEFRVCAEVPGVDASDLHVEVDPELLVIRGERRSDNPEGVLPRSERSYGAFVRRIPLPDGLRTEDARARLRNGVLEVRIPIAKLRRGREVPVENADAGRST
ncbi:MAG: Hsp20 family protein [Rhodospirillaceae bacterium]